MRAWLNLRCVPVILMLIVAPGVVLTHLLVAWLPEAVAVARLDEQITRGARQLETEWDHIILLRWQIDRLEQTVAEHQCPENHPWLPRRDRSKAFDRVATALEAPGVSIERLVVEEPGIYAAPSAADILACERVNVLCNGDYGVLAACLDRFAALDLPKRFRQVSWGGEERRQNLAIQIDVPFLPDETLRTALAEDLDIQDDEDGDES